MSGVDLGIWESVPEGSERFSDESRGKTMFFHESHRAYRLNYNLSNEANKTSELSCKGNKLNSNLPNETNKTSKLPTEADKRNNNT